MVSRSGRLQLVAPSGARITVDSGTQTFAVTATASEIRFAGSSYARAFSVGGPGYHDAAARDVLPGAKLVARLLTADRREIRVSHSAEESSTITTLIGEHHEAMTVFDGPAPSRQSVLALFDSVVITDSAAGMTVRPRAAGLSVVSEVTIVCCDGLADLAITRAEAHSLPAWRGTATKHGQVWRADRHAEAARSAARRTDYLLDFPTARVDVATAPSGAADDALLDWIDALHVDRQGSA